MFALSMFKGYVANANAEFFDNFFKIKKATVKVSY